MNKRDFIKTSLAGAFTMIAAPMFAGTSKKFISDSPKEFKLPPLPYPYDALEPYIDKETLQLHYSQYHAEYVAKLNTAIAKAGIRPGTVRKLLENASAYNNEIVSNGAEFLNHKLFWRSLTPSGEGQPSENLAIAINRDFGSFSSFKQQFEAKARDISGQGWVWLVRQQAALNVVTTQKHQNPLMNTLSGEKRGFPLLCLDMCDDAYFPLSQEKREIYITSFWDYTNWKTAEKRYTKSA